jgi:hypothetical protein
MPSPFPGMNPYFENPEIWAEVHHLLMSLLAETLNPLLLPKYRVAIEKRVYQMSGDDLLLVGIPDVTVGRAGNAPVKASTAIVSKPMQVTVPMPIDIREGYLEVRELATQEVVTVIEVLSPSNKRSGRGQAAYETKRREVLASQTHLVEIDLLRGGEPMPILGQRDGEDYRILVSRSDHRPRADLYGFNLPESIPVFSLPLRSEDAEPSIDLQGLLYQVYERAGYGVVLDYGQEPVPALSAENAAWLNDWLQSQGLR